jgi:hypothetical protein
MSAEETDKQIKDSLGTISGHFREFNNNASHFLVDGENKENIEEPLPEIKFDEVRDAETGQVYRIFIINKEMLEEGKVPLVLTFQYNKYNIGIDDPYSQELAQVMAQGGRPIIGIESPSVGGSSDMTKAQEDNLNVGKKPFEEISRSQLRALSVEIYHKSNKDKEIDFGGYSQGAINALSNAEVADEFDLKVRSVVMLDPPGITDHTEGKGRKWAIVGLGRAMRAETSNLSFYGFDDKKYSILAKSLSIKNDDISLRKMQILYSAATGRIVLPEILRSVLSKQPQIKITFINGSESKITLTEDRKKLFREFSNDRRIRWIVLPGDTHSVGVNVRRIGWLFKFIMKDQRM